MQGQKRILIKQKIKLLMNLEEVIIKKYFKFKITQNFTSSTKINRSK